MTTKRFNSKLEGVEFNTSEAAGTYTKGKLRWNDTDKALEYDTGVDDVTNTIGQEFYSALTANNTGGTITNGQVVRLNNSGEFSVAQSDSPANSDNVLGIATHDIEDGTSGFTTLRGVARGIDTSSFSVGDILYLSSSVAGGFSNTKGINPVKIGFVKTSHASTGSISISIQDERVSAVSFKDYSLTTQGLTGTQTSYLGGYYLAPATDSNLTQAGTTQTIGSSNGAYAAHAFLVAAAAGTATGGAGAVTIVVSGTSITDAGTRTGSDSETIVADITAMATDEYFETSKKWIGQVTYTLTVGGTGHTAYAADFNYGLCKYEDHGNRDFTITDFEATGLAGNTDTGFDIELIKHQTTGWTYHATAFDPTPNQLLSLDTDYSTEGSLINAENFAYKRSGLSTSVLGSSYEGVIVRVTTTANNAIENMSIHIGSII